MVDSEETGMADDEFADTTAAQDPPEAEALLPVEEEEGARAGITRVMSAEQDGECPPHRWCGFRRLTIRPTCHSHCPSTCPRLPRTHAPV